ncbi:hypothetical protein HA402_010652 [Bradysia odoriphaga]|nr:hypothetical protein HA402_010652 [Bradysia odoriphaga]
MADGCWKRRSSLEKKLIVLSILGTLVAIGLLIGLIVVAVNNNNDPTDESLESVCLTQECIAESAVVLRQMNQTADPCDDFYEFACGTFLRNTVIPDDKTTVTAFSVIENELKDQLRVIVQEPIASGEIEPFQNVKRLYRACINTALIDEQGVTPVRDVIDRMGGWPVLETNWDATNQWTWQRSVELSREFGYSVSNFMSISVSTDNKNSSRRIIRIDQASLGLNREYLILNMTDPFVQAYHSYQVDLAVLFGANHDLAVVEMREALDFEIELAQISQNREERRNAEMLYNPMTIRELQQNASFAYVGHTWTSFFNNILPPQSHVDEDTVVIVGAVSFFQQLGALIDSTPKRILANYAAWRQAVSSVNYLPSNFRSRQLEYERITTGRAEAYPRWLECVEITLSQYPIAFGALYVRKHFNAAAKEIAQEMVDNIQAEFKIMLTEIDWMDTETMEGAIEKANTIRSEIGFADELLQDSAIEEYYANEAVTVVENAYFESIRTLNRASALRHNKRLHEDVNRGEWSSHVAPAIVNAYYSSLENRIAFPAGILQGAFFNPGRPQYMNYGGIGFVIGHEITHGFDDQGSQYDSLGNLRNWWANETRAAYLEKAQCIIEQYGNYTEPQTNLPLNGINTQGENIADNGGIKESYRAYQRWSANRPEKSMPGLSDYTPQQMFWISAGQVWCSVYREAAMRNHVLTGVHSPGQFRVIGPMSNMQEFADDFNCPVGSPMNPPTADKCVVW